MENNVAKQIKKKSPAGRKPIEDKKVVVNLFIRQSELDKRGGKEEVQKQCYEFLGLSAKERTTEKGLVLRGLCAKYIQPRKTKPELSIVIFSKAMAKHSLKNCIKILKI